MLLDLTICYVLLVLWMIAGARSRRIPSWPYVLATLALGSIRALAYLVHRSFRPRRVTTPA